MKALSFYCKISLYSLKTFCQEGQSGQHIELHNRLAEKHREMNCIYTNIKSMLCAVKENINRGNLWESLGKIEPKIPLTAKK